MYLPNERFSVVLIFEEHTVTSVRSFLLLLYEYMKFKLRSIDFLSINNSKMVFSKDFPITLQNLRRQNWNTKFKKNVL